MWQIKRDLKEQPITRCRPYLDPNSYIVYKINTIYETTGNVYTDRIFDIIKGIIVNIIGEIIVLSLS